MFLRLAIASLLFSSAAIADVQFVHSPPSAQDLPSPGKMITLSVSMPREVTTVGMKVRALITRDGRLLEVQNSEPIIDLSDRALYKIQIPAPLAQMSYQFIFSDRTGASNGSKRYVVARACVPNVDLTQVGAPAATVTQEQAMRLVSEAKGLERDIALYDQVSAILDDIRKLVPQK